MKIVKTFSKSELQKVANEVKKRNIKKNHLKANFTKAKDLMISCIRELKDKKLSYDTSVVLSKKEVSELKKAKHYNEFRDLVRKTFKVQENLLCDNSAKDEMKIQNTAYDPTIDAIANAIDRVDLTTKVNRAKKEVKSEKVKKKLASKKDKKSKK